MEVRFHDYGPEALVRLLESLVKLRFRPTGRKQQQQAPTATTSSNKAAASAAGKDEFFVALTDRCLALGLTTFRSQVRRWMDKWI